MKTIIKNNRENLFFPNGFWYLYTYGVAIFFLGIGLYFTYIFIDEFLNANYGIDYHVKFLFLLFLIFTAPTFCVFKADKLYVNIYDGYFKIKNKIIPFDEIELIKYNYGYLKPFKYTIFSTVFYFVLKNGERIRFFTFFEGSENVLKQKLSEMNFDVKKCKFKNL